MPRVCPEFKVLHKGAGHRKALVFPRYANSSIGCLCVSLSHSLSQSVHAVHPHTRQPLSQSRIVSLSAQQEPKYTLNTRNSPSRSPRLKPKGTMSLCVLTLNIWGLWLVSKKREERVK
jgi:hypothetical protein